MGVEDKSIGRHFRLKLLFLIWNNLKKFISEEYVFCVLPDLQQEHRSHMRDLSVQWSEQEDAYNRLCLRCLQKKANHICDSVTSSAWYINKRAITLQSLVQEVPQCWSIRRHCQADCIPHPFHQSESLSHIQPKDWPMNIPKIYLQTNTPLH